MNCIFCNKVLVPIGNKRKNGKCHEDKEDRQLHKKCWKILKEEQELIFYMNNILKEDDDKLILNLNKFKLKYNLQKLL